MTARLDDRAREFMFGDETPIFLATLDEQERPNCVPVVTMMPLGDNQLVFGDFMLHKTRKNLVNNSCVGIAVFSDTFEGWSIKGTFLGFETEGENFDAMNRTSMFRYNAYTGVRAVGIIQIEEVSLMKTLSKFSMLSHIIWAKICSLILRGPKTETPCMPLRVQEKYNALSAIRAAAFADSDGFPRAFPMLSCYAATSNRLVLFDKFFTEFAPSTGEELAISVLTQEAISYQVKGRYLKKSLGVAVVDLSECYSASPPLLGDRLDSCLT